MRDIKEENMTEVDMELQQLRRDYARLEQENARLKANNESLESLHQLDIAEIKWLRRLAEALSEKVEPNG